MGPQRILSCISMKQKILKKFTGTKQVLCPCICPANDNSEMLSGITQSHSSKEEKSRDALASWTANVYCIRKLWWCKYCYVAKEIVKNFTPSINICTSLDKDLSMALGQNVRDVLSLKICLKMYTVILEKSRLSINLLHMYVHTYSYVDETSNLNKIFNTYTLHGLHMHTYALKIHFFPFLLKYTLNILFIKWIAKSFHKYQLLKNESVRKIQIVPNSK